MKQPVYVREFTAEERSALEAALRSPHAFTRRRARILLASAAGKQAGEIGMDVHIDANTVLNAIHAFHERGLSSLSRRSTQPRTAQFVLPPEHLETLKELLHQSPRKFGKEADRWTLDLLAEVAAEQGLATRKLTPQGMRRALRRAGIPWRRAKNWIRWPDPEYARKDE